MEAAAGAIIRTAAIAPGHDSELHRTEGRQVLGPVDDVPRQRGHFFLHRRETATPWRVGPPVDLGLTRERGGVRLLCRWLSRLLREGDDREARRRDGDDERT